LNPAKLILSFVAASFLLVAPASAQGGHGRPAKTYKADVPVAWFNLMYDRVKADALSPPVASRRYGIAGVALYEAIVPGMSQPSLGGQLNQLAPFTPPAPGTQFHWPTVANAALGRTLEVLFTGSANSLAAIAALRAQLAAQLGQGVNAATIAASEARGVQIADAITAWAATDGFAALNNCPYAPPTGDGMWVPTPPLFAPNPLQPCWGQLRTFAVASGTSCPPPPPPAFSTVPGSPFHAMALEVYDTVNNLTPEQETIANFWADNPTATGTPPGHWVSIVSQILIADSESLATAGRAYARLGIAVADAFICCWNTKYQYNLLRPVSYIRDHIDPLWTSFVGTPPFPEYTSGHSTQSGAAAAVLADLFGDRAFVDNTHTIHNPALNLAPRSFNTFAEAAAEAALSRLYGGIHYTPANQNGLAQGQCLAQSMLSTLNF
jgi:PAP2 superfamily